MASKNTLWDPRVHTYVLHVTLLGLSTVYATYFKYRVRDLFQKLKLPVKTQCFTLYESLINLGTLVSSHTLTCCIRRYIDIIPKGRLSERTSKRKA